MLKPKKPRKKMHKLDWYIIKKFLGSFFLSIALIIIIVVVFDISEKLGHFLERDAPLKAIIFDYYVNFIPYFINMFSSLFIFISVIFFTSRMAQNTEIVPMLSSGISFYRLMVPYVLCAVFIGLLNLLLANFVIPDVNKERIAFERVYVKKPYQNANSNIHIQFDSNTYYYVESFDNRSNVGYRFTREKIEGNRLQEKLSAQNIRYDFSNLTGKQRRHCIPYLLILLRTVSFKKVIVWKALEPRSLADGQTSALQRIVMDEIVPVLSNMSCNRRGRLILELNSEPVIKDCRSRLPGYVFVPWQKLCRKIL